MPYLNNREIASLIWLTLFIAWGLSHAPVRSSLSHLVRSFLSKPILLSLAAMAGYVAICVALLARLGIWQADNLKATLIWATTFAFATMMEIDRITEDNTYFHKTISEIVSVTVVVIFITAFFTFSLPVEMVLVPALAFLGVLHAMSSTRKEWAQVERLLLWTLSLIGLSLIIHALYRIGDDWSEFATLETARDFFMPILLSFLFLPFIYLLSVYAVYERVFLRLSFRIEDKSLLDYAKAQAILSFRFDLEYLRRWARDVALRDVPDRQAIVSSIRHVKSVKQRERNPPDIPASQGWSPYIAMAFLHKEGLKPGDYHRTHGEWRAASPYMDISNDIVPDHIAYCVEGKLPVICGFRRRRCDRGCWGANTRRPEVAANFRR